MVTANIASSIATKESTGLKKLFKELIGGKKLCPSIENKIFEKDQLVDIFA